MQFLAKTFLLVIAGSLHLASATPTASDLSKYNFDKPSPLTIIGSLKPGGPNVTISGSSAEDIYKEFVKMNPSYEEDWAGYVHPDLKLRESALLEKRNKLNCAYWPPSVVSPIDSGIKYLSNLGKQGKSAYVGAGPGTCARVSCSYNGAIWLCNDRNYGRSISASAIALVAQDIRSHCSYSGGPGVGDKVSGQEFVADLWNVIVRFTSC